MRRSVRTKWIVVLAAAGLGCASAANAQQSPLIVLSAPSDPTVAERGVVTFSISNPTDERIAVVSFETPFAIADDHLANPEFEVTDAAGHELQYRGRQVHFGPPDSSSFLIIEPHQTISKDVDLAAEYGMAKGGAYKVTYVKTLRLLRSSGIERIKALRQDDEIPLEDVRSNTLTVWVNEALTKQTSAPQARRAVADDAGAAVCTDSQSATLSSDVSAAASQATAALFHLQSGYTYDQDENGIDIHAHQTDPRYTYWFGTYDSSIFLTDPEAVHSDNAQVDQILAATAYRLSSGPMSFTCGCSASYPAATRAWAETGSPYLVHICASYFNDPTTGGSPAPSRVATLVHEASHFMDQYAIGTADNYYTSPEAHAAAVSARSTAVRTAVNYEFYIMNATHP